MDNVIIEIKSHFPKWTPSTAQQEYLSRLSAEKSAALLRIVKVEATGKPSFRLRQDNFSDFELVDVHLNAVLSDILASDLPIPADLGSMASSYFERDLAGESREQTELRKNGYVRSGHKLRREQIDTILTGLRNVVFTTRSQTTHRVTGGELLDSLHDPDRLAVLVGHGDTYWAADLNELVRLPDLEKLAFDPYIVSMAANYLGCCPVHVQTNVWFSFRTTETGKNLSENAQLFHQDKEFLKFLKAFIYLSDVGPENGPHCYVERSHIDEAISYGIPFSTRLTDDRTAQLYGRDRIKCLTGPKGSIIFGDTSCMHKGEPVKSGFRLMLQLEYTSSLYCSTTMPFGDLPEQARAGLPYPQRFSSRLVSNYNAGTRQSFIDYFNALAATRRKRVSRSLKKLRMRIRSLPGSLQRWFGTKQKEP